MQNQKLKKESSLNMILGNGTITAKEVCNRSALLQTSLTLLITVTDQANYEGNKEKTCAVTQHHLKILKI